MGPAGLAAAQSIPAPRCPGHSPSPRGLQLWLRAPRPLGTALVVGGAREPLSRVPGRAPGGRMTSARAQAAVAVGFTCGVAATAVLAAPDAPARLHAAYCPVASLPTGTVPSEAVGGSAPWSHPAATATGPVERRPSLPRPIGRWPCGEIWSRRPTSPCSDRGGTDRVGASDPAASAQWVEGRLDVTDLRGLGVDVVVRMVGHSGSTSWTPTSCV